MFPAPFDSATIPLTASVVAIDDDPASFACLACQSSLELLQPDPTCPDHLLGTCPSCGAWHPIVVLPGGATAVVAPIALAEMARMLGWTGVPSRAEVA